MLVISVLVYLLITSKVFHLVFVCIHYLSSFSCTLQTSNSSLQPGLWLSHLHCWLPRDWNELWPLHSTLSMGVYLIY